MNDFIERVPGYLTEEEEGTHGPLSRRFKPGEPILPPTAKDHQSEIYEIRRMDKTQIMKALSDMEQEN